ncbi:hypothetical protein [Haloferula sp. BvORR071]|uniref:hypothetical protein n=1 Tax=Haloferula sp. BvORR071 TaxID=1396141 RepID=UPI000555CB9D|nr:hypothetical protein [Haloferula sp. BvORR071]
MTRRQFLKRTGGATAVSLIAWNVASLERARGTTVESSDVTVEMKDFDLGLDQHGYREEMQEFTGKYDWIYGNNAPMTLPHDTATPANSAPPNYCTITATVHPKDAEVEFRVRGDEPGCITIFETVNDGSGTVLLRIQAVTPSTPINGGRRPKGSLIEAVHQGNVVGSAKCYVVKPDKIVKGTNPIASHPGMFGSTGYYAHAQYEGQIVAGLPEHQTPPATLALPMVFLRLVQVRINNQFNEPLGPMYYGTAVQEDSLCIAWMRSGQYNDPVGRFANGEDQTPFQIYVAGHDCGQLRRKLTISNATTTTADYLLEWL